MNEPLVSIVTPTFNRSRYLREAIESAQAQTVRNFEHIVIDDHSTEDVESVVREFHNPEIRYIRNETNLGMSKNYNKAFKEAKGEYIALFEDDDIWLPDYLEKQLAVLRADPTIGAVYCQRIIVDSNNKTLFEEPRETFENVFEACLRTPQMIPTVMVVKRSVIAAIGGFDEAMSKGTDWDFSIRVAQAAKTVLNPQWLVRYRSHPGQLSNEFSAERQKAIDLYLFMYKKFEKEYRSRPEIDTDFLRNVGTNYCLIGNMSEGRHYFIRALKANPRRLKNYRSLLLSLLSGRVYLKLHKLVA